MISVLSELAFGVMAVIFQFSEIFFIFIGLTLFYDRINSIRKRNF